MLRCGHEFSIVKANYKVYKLKPLQAFINILWGVLDIQQPMMLFQNKGLKGSNKPVGIDNSPSESSQ